MSFIWWWCRALLLLWWQRTHFRHPDTPAPRLQTLIEIFRDWQCTDIRDKVFALVSMAATNSNIVPDYALSTREVYFAVLDALDEDKTQFASLLSQLLGLARRDINLRGQSLYVIPEIHKSDLCVLTNRQDWVQDTISWKAGAEGKNATWLRIINLCQARCIKVPWTMESHQVSRPWESPGGNLQRSTPTQGKGSSKAWLLSHMCLDQCIHDELWRKGFSE